MTVGTKSLLFGVHQFVLHPLFVAWAWWRLYGFPWHPALWICILVHDWGYWGKPNMDGPEGERHPELGARLASHLLDDPPRLHYSHAKLSTTHQDHWIGPWGQFCLFHSRHYAKKHGHPFSRLCVADKYAICLYPAWLYLALAWSTGELREYMAHAKANASQSKTLTEDERHRMASTNPWEWHAGLNAYMARWVNAHKAGQPDHWITVTNGSSHDEEGIPSPPNR